MSSSEQSLFETYEKAYCNISTEVSKALNSLEKAPIDERSLKAKKLDRQLKEAEQTLQRLDMEARTAPAPASTALVRKVKDYRKDLQKLSSEVKRMAMSAQASEASRAELGLADSYYHTSAGQRERLLTASERLHKTSDKIQEGRKQLLETEEIGVSVLSDLQRQRESIMHSRETLSHVDANIGKARQILATMSRRITQNKFIMYGIIALLIGAIGLLIWAKLS